MLKLSKSSAALSQNNKNMRAYVFSLIIGLITAGLALLFFSLIIWFFELPVAQNDFFASLAFGAGSLFSGIFMGWVKRQNGIVKGAKAALFFILPILLVSAVTSGFTGALLIERIITAVICGSVGGVIGVNKKK